MKKCTGMILEAFKTIELVDFFLSKRKLKREEDVYAGLKSNPPPLGKKSVVENYIFSVIFLYRDRINNKGTSMVNKIIKIFIHFFLRTLSTQVALLKFLNFSLF